MPTAGVPLEWLCDTRELGLKAIGLVCIESAKVARWLGGAGVELAARFTSGF